MVDVREAVLLRDGFARKRELVDQGATDLDLTRAVRSGSVLRARNGWYSTAAETDPDFRAIRVGGRLTGASLLQAEGAWMARVEGLDVSVKRNSARLRSQWNKGSRLTRHRRFQVRLHWSHPDEDSRGERTRVAFADALVVYLHDVVFEEAVAVLDWVRHTSRIDWIDYERVIARLPRRLRGIDDWVDPSCESYLESLARTRLRMRGLQVVSQRRLPNDQRIDLVVEGTAAIELDGREHHESRFEYDRLKDLEITLAGMHSIRISSGMLHTCWPRILAAIDEILRARGVTLSTPAGLLRGDDWTTSTRMIGTRGHWDLRRLR